LTTTMHVIAVLTSAGDAPGMNTATYTVVHTAVQQGVSAIDVRGGCCGLIAKDSTPLDYYAVADVITHGGTLLATHSRLPRFPTA
jgi:6-phosphofructokinase 1